jgi:hypothetical protein
MTFVSQFLLASVPLITLPIFLYARKKAPNLLLYPFRSSKGERTSKLQKFFRSKTVLLGLMSFEDLIVGDFRVLSLWILSFTLWILSCSYWILQNIIVAQIFVSAAIVIYPLVIFNIYRMKSLNFSHIKKEKPNLSGYILCLYLSVVIMVISYSFSNGIVSFLLCSILWYNLRTHMKAV